MLSLYSTTLCTLGCCETASQQSSKRRATESHTQTTNTGVHSQTQLHFLLHALRSDTTVEHIYHKVIWHLLPEHRHIISAEHDGNVGLCLFS